MQERKSSIRHDKEESLRNKMASLMKDVDKNKQNKAEDAGEDKVDKTNAKELWLYEDI